MKRLVLVATLVGLVVGGLAHPPSFASWVSEHCFADSHSDSNVKREEARAYANIAAQEGYEWGGGCWNNNNVDDTPGQPDSGGEGPDCSGFTFKTWEMKNSEGTGGFQWWNRFQNIHGPYSSYDFHSPVASDPFFKLANKKRETTLYMDAFAKDGHIGMIHSDLIPDGGGDYIIEAYGDYSGTDINVRTYRGDSEYVGVRREGWTPDCYPNCERTGATVVVLP